MIPINVKYALFNERIELVNFFTKNLVKNASNREIKVKNNE